MNTCDSPRGSVKAFQKLHPAHLRAQISDQMIQKNVSAANLCLNKYMQKKKEDESKQEPEGKQRALVLYFGRGRCCEWSQGQQRGLTHPRFKLCDGSSLRWALRGDKAQNSIL